MQHLSITFPDDLKAALDQEAKREHTKRSTLIQKAVKVYLGLKRRRALEGLLREGYEEMTAESSRLVKDFQALDRESLKHLD